MYGHIYETTNNINGMLYIGQHQGEGNDDYLGSGIRITAAIKKYGRENFSKRVIFYCDTKEELDFSETLFIAAYRQLYGAEMMYNIAEGGQGGAIRTGMHHSEEAKQKLREANTGEKHPMYGKHHSEETKQKQREAKKGNKYHAGKHHSEETKQKQREANIGKHHSEEAKRKMSEKRKEYWRKKKETE